jgi:tol-pal system protein YbgF
MRRKLAVLFLSSLALGLCSVRAAEKQGPAIGIGLNAGVQKPFCDVLHTGMAPAGELMLRFIASDILSLSLSVGGGVLSDGFNYYTYQTQLLTGDIKANISLAKTGRVRPYIFVGASAFSFEYTRNKSWAIGLPANEGKRFSSSSLILGGGMEILTSPQFALNLFADYRNTPTDLLDGAEVGKAKDGYLNGRIGFTYYFKKRSVQPPKTEDELIALQQGEYGSSSEENKQKLSMFEAKLDKLEAGDADMSMESYVRLKSRVDELNQLIDSKEHELEDLRSTLDFKNKRIVDLESSIKTGSSAASGAQVDVGDFSQSYDEALRQFYAHRYQDAMALFTALKQKYPQHQLTGNCQYWIGECWFGLQDYRNASEAFQSVFDWANTMKKDDATLMLGRCYYNLRDMAKARSYFQGVLDDYPDSEYSEKAKQWLSRIG